MRLLLLFLSVFFLVICANAQVKYEKEYKLKTKDVPGKALEFVNGLNVMGKKKWYHEENLVGNSVECKFDYSSNKYSVEFDSFGNILDVEKEIAWEEIGVAVQERITSEFLSRFSKYKINKVQVQYIGSKEDLKSVFKSGEFPFGVIVNYEIVVKGKASEETKLFELTFDGKGKQIEEKEVIFKNFDNLEY